MTTKSSTSLAVTQPAAVERRKAPMDWAASVLAEICDEMDNTEGAITDDMLARFEDASIDLAEAVDRRIAFDTWIKGATKAARKARDEWNDRVQKLKALHDRFKERTKAIIEDNPNLPYQGNLGKMRVQKSAPSVETTFGDKELTKDLIDMFGIEERFIRRKVEYAVDAQAVKDAIKAGEEISWAQLKQSSHVRFGK